MVIKEKHIRSFAIIVMVSIVLSGATVFSYVRVPRIWLTGICGVVFFAFGGNHEFRKSWLSKIFLAWLLFLGVNYMCSYSPDNTLAGLIIFLSLYFMMHIRFKESDFRFMFSIMRVICVIYAISILMSAIVTGPFYALFSGLIAQSMATINQEIANGAYSGLVGERAIAAYFMNIGVAIELSKYFADKKLKKINIFLIIIYTVALMMTGKRMLFAIELVLIAMAIFFAEIKGKYVKVIFWACLIIPISIVIISVIPQTQILFQRMVEYSGDDMLNGRAFFWEYCLLMFIRKPVIGYGFDSFNEAFADEVNYIYKGKVWDMYAHNIYYELLGEVGIVGAFLFVLLLLVSVVGMFKLMRNEKKNERRALLFGGLAFQIMFIIYGFTGNCLYENEQLMLCFIGMLIGIVISRGKKNLRKNNMYDK